MKINYRCMEFNLEEVDGKFKVTSTGFVKFKLTENSKNMAIIMAQCHIDKYFKTLTKM